MTVLAKNPFTTRVKTRLAGEIGEDAARGTYARLLYHTLNTLVSGPPHATGITLSLASPEDRFFFERAFPELAVNHQAPGDLGAKIQHALKEAFQHGAQKAVVIGSDLPFMDWDLLNQAFAEIRSETVVLGPASDGGYYLVGMQAPGVNVFKDIPWSSSGVLQMTLLRVRAEGYQPRLLPEFQDIDHLSDLEAWQAGLMQRNQSG